jgi:hypothetical protein
VGSRVKYVVNDDEECSRPVEPALIQDGLFQSQGDPTKVWKCYILGVPSSKDHFDPAAQAPMLSTVLAEFSYPKMFVLQSPRLSEMMTGILGTAVGR